MWRIGGRGGPRWGVQWLNKRSLGGWRDETTSALRGIRCVRGDRRLWQRREQEWLRWQRRRRRWWERRGRRCLLGVGGVRRQPRRHLEDRVRLRLDRVERLPSVAEHQRRHYVGSGHVHVRR